MKHLQVDRFDSTPTSSQLLLPIVPKSEGIYPTIMLKVWSEQLL